MKITNTRPAPDQIKGGDVFEDERGYIYIAGTDDPYDGPPTWALQLDTGALWQFKQIAFPRKLDAELIIR